MSTGQVIVVITILIAAAGIVAYRLLGPKIRDIPVGDRRITGRIAVEAAPTRVRTLMMVVVSIAVLGSSLYIILSKGFDEASKKWAFGVVGTILGFWLRPEM